MELEYRKEGDYYLPNLLPPDSPRVGKFGRMYLRHLREDKEGIYTGMLLKGTLKEHVETIDRDAHDLYETIVRNQARQYGVNEELKARDQMEWVRWMNAIRLVAEEVVIKEVLQL